MAAKGKVCQGRIKRSVINNRRLYRCPLKIERDDFNISMQNLFKVSKSEGFQNGTLEEI